jgi:chromate reductase
MRFIISGTNRPNSNSLKVSKILMRLYLDIGEACEMIDLAELPLSLLEGRHYMQETKPSPFAELIEKLTKAESLHFVVPEYNGSYPGALKYFIDFWKFPESFEFLPVAFVGLGGRFGGLRPVEHLQQVFGYRNAFVFPERVFMANIWNIMSKEGEVTDPVLLELLKSQVHHFSVFSKTLETSGLHGVVRLKR